MLLLKKNRDWTCILQNHIILIITESDFHNAPWDPTHLTDAVIGFLEDQQIAWSGVELCKKQKIFILVPI